MSHPQATVLHAGQGVMGPHTTLQDGPRCCTPCHRADNRGSDEVMLYGKARRSAARGDLQLPVDRTQVGVDGTGTDVQVRGDVRRGEPLGDEPQDLDLASGQVGGIAGFGGAGADGSAARLARARDRCRFASAWCRRQRLPGRPEGREGRRTRQARNGG